MTLHKKRRRVFRVEPVTLSRHGRHVKLTCVVRRAAREADGSDEAAALDRDTRTFRRTEALYDRQRETLWNSMLAAKARGMSTSEIARRTGYTREYTAELLSRLKRQREAAEAKSD